MLNSNPNHPRTIPLCALLLAWLLSTPASAQKPDIFLLKTYDGSQDVVGWVMSEKLDGVRGVWDGERLLSQGGETLHAPPWFTRGFPPFALDGELWSQRADFENIVSIVRSHASEASDARWRQVRYHVFEVPQQAGGLLDRLAVLRDYLAQHPAERIVIIPQTRVNAADELTQFLAEVSAGGGEGVVVRDPDRPYETGRLSSALKAENHLDTECAVREILPGKGKYTGKMGALRCRMADGSSVKIGSGFTDQLRAQPPPVGSVITFKYYGLTRNGKPRFPVYLHARQ